MSKKFKQDEEYLARANNHVKKYTKELSKCYDDYLKALDSVVSSGITKGEMHNALKIFHNSAKGQKGLIEKLGTEFTKNVTNFKKAVEDTDTLD